MNWNKTLLISVIILLTGGAVTALIFTTEPEASRSGATQETAMLVNIIEVNRDNYQPIIEAMGTVRASQDITLSPRVSGQIVERSDEFTPGGYVREGDTLLRIDPSDYENNLEQQRSELQQAMADLDLEMGRQEAAEKEYELYGDTLSEQNKARILRKPQLDAVRAQVAAARAAVNRAEMDLKRTTLTAPFDAHIISRNVNIGSQVAPGNNLGRLVGLDTYWVEASVPLSKLRWLNIRNNDNSEGSEVRIRNRTAWQADEYRSGTLFKMVGFIEEQTRMARVLVEIPDPMAYRDENSGSPSLIIGSFVETNIEGNELTDVIRLNRDYVRSNDTVWIMEDGKLRIRDIDVVMRDANYAYISEGLNDTDKVVTTNLSTVSDGAPLRLEGSASQNSSRPDSLMSDM
ncbi:efflux RND transporter periplasmic adaptor subunit [Balneolaceae bacterium YR4-1]|uniref:Efflux RND transporter periplasmic adaptor subunit n=1 Tax=Halalkalibaculum roseum TaxID=2709311 RepID=A0A6M1STA1_9BACT|nr:efflux RND transporter periplasmic adaptor subunit [Halalkalibaculum roseum]NGP76120.1 efflux RND transporter periplasmic adaptor subunit [Halalkalibaculum roseum]